MRYTGVVYRPPSEANSLLIQATIGCPHNRCTFCAMYKGTKFKIRKVEEIKEDLDMALAAYGSGIRAVFFPDGNTIYMKTDQLEEIFRYTGSLFPLLERITLYGSAKFVNLKSLEELERLQQAGLIRLHMGMESGDDLVLAKLQKGSNSCEVIEAGQKVVRAGIELSMYYLVGSGGAEYWEGHAVNSAKTLSKINPRFIRLRTLVPDRNTPLFEDWQKGVFQLPRAHQALREVQLFIENLSGTVEVLSDHISNYWNICGRLPWDQAKMLAQIDAALAIPEEKLRRSNLHRL